MYSEPEQCVQHIIVQSNVNGRIGLGWFQLSILIMDDVRRGKENGSCTPCIEEDY